MSWDVTPDDLDQIAIGAGILGAGGGGNPEQGRQRALRELAQGRRLRVVALDELPDDALVVPVGGMGAPTLGIEKIGKGDEATIAVQAIADSYGVEIEATVAVEIGGTNSVVPLIVGGHLGLPAVDADGMGRAFPEGSMISYYFDGRPAARSVMVDARHRQITFEGVRDTVELERLARAMCVQLGGRVFVADAPLSVARLRETAIPGTLSWARELGHTVLQARRGNRHPVEAILCAGRGRRLFRGKVTDVERRVERGYNFGRLTLEGTDGWRYQVATIDLQNEYLILRVNGEVVMTVPDIITLVDGERGQPITTELVRYGLRVEVLGIPAAPQLKTPLALTHVGPRAFGYDLDFVPLRFADP